MNALDIIVEKVSCEGREHLISREVLVQLATERIAFNHDLVFQYGNVVFTVSRNPYNPVVHLYSLGVGPSLLKAVKDFTQQVWKKIGHKYLTAPIENESVQKLATRNGWWDTGEYSTTGHKIYRIERPK